MDILSTLFKLSKRQIGIMVPDVVVSEKHSDSLEITEHPVGAQRNQVLGWLLITPTSARVKSQWNVASLVAVRYSMPLIPEP
jgi:hypothetical protein